jgi:N-acetylmuramoyl-L-alanine amidase
MSARIMVVCAGVVLALVAPGEAGAVATGPLADRVIVLDAGHDGGNAAQPAAINRLVPDGRGGRKACDTAGTATPDGYPEHAFTLDVVRRAAALLRQRGARVVLTRTTDSGVGPCVDARAAVGNRAHADAAVSVHADGGPAGGRGFHVAEPGYVAVAPSRRVLGVSDRLARLLRATMEADTGTRPATYLAAGTGITRRTDLAGLNLSTVPKVFLEAANMRNPGDAARTRDPRFRQRVALAVADAVTLLLRP